MEVVLATRNRKKAEELIDHLRVPGVRFKTLLEVPQQVEIREEAHSFAENAREKAIATARLLGSWAIGEDSGLVVDALDGAPGPRSARFAGPQATDEENNRKLLELLRDVPLEKRTAHYVSHVVLADPQGNVIAEAEGRCYGLITQAPRGSHGFGYDPLFLVPEYHRTFGELGLTVKRWLSHRARACEQLRPHLLRIAANRPDP